MNRYLIVYKDYAGTLHQYLTYFTYSCQEKAIRFGRGAFGKKQVLYTFKIKPK